MTTRAVFAQVAIGLMGLGGLVAEGARPARACGGFFCNAQAPTPIVQAGERVLFAAHDGLVTMHIEIAYQGDPTLFGWILPMAEAPMDASGTPLPLEKAVEVSSQLLFPALQAATDPRFNVRRDESDTTWCEKPACPPVTYPEGGWTDTTSSVQDTSSPMDTSLPTVEVVDEARVGPYNAQLIVVNPVNPTGEPGGANDVDALYAWLGANGYTQDEAARPLLAAYVRKGFKFLGVRLRSGRGVNDLRPLAVTLREGAPCVPLTLTQIAATPDMPITVWVLGPARAVPKNFIHAVIDWRAFPFPSPGPWDYRARVANAVDIASGRAWLTEFAGVPPNLWEMSRWLGTSTVGLDEATSLAGVLREMASKGVDSTDPDLLAAVREAVARPSGLRGYPYGNCQYCQGCSWAASQCEEIGQPNDTHETTDAELYAFIDYWAERDERGDIALAVDLPALKALIATQVIAPRRSLAVLLRDARRMTRFFTLISPFEMNRDPLFAFNPELPDVPRDRWVTWDLVDCDSAETLLRYDDGSQRRVRCESCRERGWTQGFGAASVSPLRYAEVIDEDGEPMPFETGQVATVDMLLDSAWPGVASLPPAFVARPPIMTEDVVSDPGVTSSLPWYCPPSGVWPDPPDTSGDTSGDTSTPDTRTPDTSPRDAWVTDAFGRDDTAAAETWVRESEGCTSGGAGLGWLGLGLLGLRMRRRAR